MINIKYTTNKVIDIIENTEFKDGYKLKVFEDFVYSNNLTKIKIIDNFGYLYNKTWQSLLLYIKNKKKPNIISKNEYAEYNIKLFMKLNCPDIQFIKYEDGGYGFIYYKCNKGHFGKRPTSEILKLKNKCCAQCNKRNITMDLIIKEFNDVGYKVILDKTIFNKAKTKVFYICPKHGEKNILYDSFHSGVRCIDCGREKTINALKYSYEDFILDYNKLNITKYQLICKKYEYVNTRSQVSLLCKNCNKEFMLGVHNILRNNIYCPHCEVYGENSKNWRGGITPLHKYLRNCIYKWKQETEYNDNKCCYFTKQKQYDIHHKVSFNLILSELIKLTRIPIYQDISKYTQQELSILREICCKLHEKYGLGVCLSESIHKLFHKTYGYGNNTIKQWDKFEKDFKEGKYTKGIDY